MIRSYENPYAWRAGAMSLFVHALLLTLLLASFNWKTTQPMSVAQVELWDSLPATKPVAKVKPVVVKPQPPEPPKPVVEEKPEPKPEPVPKADIQVKKEVEKPKDKVVKLEKPVEKVKDEPKPKVDDKKQKDEALKKLQQELLAEDAKPALHESKKQEGKPDAAVSAATANELNAAIAGIRNKIRQNVNNQLCGSDDIELIYKIVVIPTGEVASISLIKSSKIPACDEAVERAIHSSEPLPMPKDPNLISQFHNLTLPFRPNGKN